MNLVYKAIWAVFLYTNILKANAFDWSQTTASYLYGTSYERVGSSSSVSYPIITLEHASGHKFGDNFFFVDILEPGSSNSDLYLEWAPRISSAKLLDIAYGTFIKDILLAFQINIVPKGAQVDLYGVGVDFAVPYFNFFQVNFYSRNDRALESSTYQITLAWELLFSLYKQEFIFTGFTDIAGKEGHTGNISNFNILAQPQIFWKIHKDFGLGVEYQYWKNKFGIKGINESTPQLLIKWFL